MSRQINLFNPDLQYRRAPFSAIAMVQALALVLHGCAVIGGYAAYKTSRLKQEAAAAAAQLAATRTEIDRAASLLRAPEKNAVIEQQVSAAEMDLKSAREVLQVLDSRKANEGQHYSEYLRAFARQIGPGIWITGFNIAGDELDLHGRAVKPELIPAYIGRLQTEPSLRGKSFGMLEVQTPVTNADAKDKTATALAKGSTGLSYLEFRLRSSQSNPSTSAAASGGKS